LPFEKKKAGKREKRGKPGARELREAGNGEMAERVITEQGNQGKNQISVVTSGNE
jgi:hypothetical protein